MIDSLFLDMETPAYSGMVLSVRQPWAWLIIRPDITDPAERAKAFAAGLIKDIENRTWPTKVRGRVLIHAGKGMTRDEYEDACDFVKLDVDSLIVVPRYESLQRGGIVGEVEIMDCVTRTSSRWFMGDYGLPCGTRNRCRSCHARGSWGFSGYEL